MSSKNELASLGWSPELLSQHEEMAKALQTASIKTHMDLRGYLEEKGISLESLDTSEAVPTVSASFKILHY